MFRQTPPINCVASSVPSEPAGSWTGGCATVAGTLEGPISSVVIFGNGAERRVTLHLAPA